MDDLRETVKQMNVAWRRLSQRAEFPAVGWVKSLEVTRGENDSAHPHFHVLMMVKSSYFSHGYVKHERWVQLWQEAMRLNYAPSVNVRRVRYEEKTLETSNSSDTDLKLDDGIERFDNEARSNILLALLEAFKYTVKPGDLLRSVDPTWLVGLTQQLHKTKAVAVGGILKKYFNENEPEDLIDVSSEPKEVELVSDLMFAYFGWREMTHRYTKVSKGESSE